MSKNRKTKKSGAELEEGRAAYMIAWREKKIDQMEEMMKGLEGKSALLEAMLVCLLLREGEGERERTVRLGRAEVSARLGAWRSEAHLDGEDYVVTFTKKGEAADGASPCKS